MNDLYMCNSSPVFPEVLMLETSGNLDTWHVQSVQVIVGADACARSKSPQFTCTGDSIQKSEGEHKTKHKCKGITYVN